MSASNIGITCTHIGAFMVVAFHGMHVMEPMEQYRRNRAVYDRIHDSLQDTYVRFERGDRATRRALLEKAVRFALISAQAPVKQHEAGYLNTIGVVDRKEAGQKLQEAGVNYCINKGKYISHNHHNADWEYILDSYEESGIDSLHRALVDECKGVGPRKAGFALALSVTDEKMCIDTHVAQSAGIEADDIYNGVVIDRYEAQCADVLASFPTLSEILPPFMVQWVVFDSNRTGVATHDAWFMSLDGQETTPA